MMMMTVQIVGALVFGVTFLVTMLVVAIRFSHPTQLHRQPNVVRTGISLAAAGYAATIPGFLEVEISATTNLLVRAGGALGVFVIVYFFNPARLALVPAKTFSTESEAGQDNWRTLQDSNPEPPDP